MTRTLKNLLNNEECLTPLQQQVLTQKIHAQLPQTQCKRCGFEDCDAYAKNIVEKKTSINRCQPGGMEGVKRLAQLTGDTVEPLAKDVGKETPRIHAVIDEHWCIGCTKCIQVCPVDAIIGRSKKMHTVIEEQCTGCELCHPICPTDCIEKRPTSKQTPEPTGWAAWSQQQAQNALTRYHLHVKRTSIQRPALSKIDTPRKTIIATSSEHEKRNFMAQIMLKAQQQEK